jgi:hypothetical protein
MADPITSPNSPSGEVTLVLDWLLLVTSAAMILARLYLRLRINRQKLLPSDVLICLAWCAATTTISLDIVLFRMDVLRKGVDPFLRGYHGDKKSLQRAIKVSRHLQLIKCSLKNYWLIFLLVLLGCQRPVLHFVLSV